MYVCDIIEFVIEVSICVCSKQDAQLAVWLMEEEMACQITEVDIF